MLEQLITTNFVLSEKNTIDFKDGMTAITGETGAGKSLTVDAISAVTGARAESGWVRSGADKAEAEALFDIKGNRALSDYLSSRDLNEDGDELAMRRVVTSDGKSRSYVNGHNVTLSVLKEVGALLVAVHGQHA